MASSRGWWPVHGRASRGRAIGAATAAALLLATAGCSGSSDAPKPPATSAPTAEANLTFGVFGPQAEVQAFQANVDSWNAKADHGQVKLESWPDRAAMRGNARA